MGDTLSAQVHRTHVDTLWCIYHPSAYLSAYLPNYLALIRGKGAQEAPVVDEVAALVVVRSKLCSITEMCSWPY